MEKTNKIKENKKYYYCENGKRNSKGREYNEKGKLIFKEEFLNGKKWKGFENVYDKDTGKTIFKYEYKKEKEKEQ